MPSIHLLVLLFTAASSAAPVGLDKVALEREASRHGAALAAELERSSRARYHLAAASLHAIEARGARTVDAPQAWRRVDAALQRAVALDPNDPLVWWTMATECDDVQPGCDADGAVARLRALAPHNAAVWLLPDTHRAGATVSGIDSSADQDERLARIAAASGYDSYLGDLVRSHHEALGVLPFPATLAAAVSDAAPPDPREARLVWAFSLLLSGNRPTSRGLSELCGADAVTRGGAPRAERCIAALDRMLPRVDTVMDALLVARARLALTRDPQARGELERARDAIQWRYSAAMELLGTADVAARRQAIAEQLSLLLEPGATELGVMRQLLEARGIAPLPPPGWKGWHGIEVERQQETQAGGEG